MKKTLFKNWGIVLVGIVGVMILGGYNFKSLLDEVKNFFSPNADVDPKNDTGATISDTESQILAENLYNAMDGMGTDENAIYLTFRKMKNRADYNKTYNAFGKRQYSRTWGNVGDPITSTKRDMIQWLSYELTQDEQNKLTSDNPQLNIFTY